jgi:signal transduction histidine kinase
VNMPQTLAAESHAGSGLGPADLRHALRTPLNHIIGFSEILLEDLQKSGATEDTVLLEQLRRIARDLVTAVEVELAGTLDQTNYTPSDVLAAVRAKIRATVAKIAELKLNQAAIAARDPEGRDVRRILNAVGLLTELAHCPSADVG